MKHLALLVFLVACGSKSAPPSNPTPPAGSGDGAGSAAACVKTGCSGTVCAEPGNEVMTTCEMKPEYACYGSATCERQPDGACGWTQTDELKACLASPPPL